MKRHPLRGAARGLLALSAVAAALVLPSAALAAGPAKASPGLYLGQSFTIDHSPVTVPGRPVTVTGVVRPYVPGQSVVMKEFLNGRQFKSVTLRLKPSKHGVYGGFTLPVRGPAAGWVSIVVDHAATPGLSGFQRRTGFDALNESVHFGATGRFVQLLQQRLSDLHFYIPRTGVYDQGTGLAVDAYHRMLGWGTSQMVGAPMINELLNGVGAFHIRFPHQGMHAEGDLSDQLLALADGSKVYWIFPISSGKPSTPTVLGSWQIYRRTPGYLPDGMYYSDFFIRGYAIHGYDPAPNYPASHGCMRLPIVDAIPAFNWLALGDWVDTYYT